jgi:hypothetical protein
MSLTWGLPPENDTKWIEQAMDEYHAKIRAERCKMQKRNWKFSDCSPSMQSQLLQRAAELKKGGR